MGMETLLMHSPEDSLSLPVKLADRSYKFYSSRLEDSYLDMEAIIEKAREVHADYIHPGYGFLAENPEFARLCSENNIRFIGPDSPGPGPGGRQDQAAARPPPPWACRS